MDPCCEKRNPTPTPPHPPTHLYYLLINPSPPLVEGMISRSPVDPLLLCAGAAHTNISCFVTRPCFSFLCARALNTRLYVRLCYNASERPGLSALCFCAQGRSIRTFRLFGLLWAPLAAPKLPTWSLLGSAGCPNCFPGRPESLIWCLPGPTGCSM